MQGAKEQRSKGAKTYQPSAPIKPLHPEHEYAKITNLIESFFK